MKSPDSIKPGLVLLMAFTVGAVVANVYYVQPLLAEIARTFGLSVTGAGRLATLIQIGVAVGQFVFVPLGDILERRRLTLRLILAAAVALALMTVAPTVGPFALACFLLGTTASAAHVILPFAATLAPPERRGKVVGQVFSGLLMGILLARTYAGVMASFFGWRAVYGVACGAMLLLAVLVRANLPQGPPISTLSWTDLLRSIPPMWRELPVWREACLTGMLVFSTFSAFWTTLIFFLESPAYHYGSREAGLFGLIGLAGALCAPLVGKLADRHGARRNVAIALWINVAAWAVMAIYGKVLWGLIAGVLLLDLAVQAVQVSNQTRVYALRPDARSRLNMVYMTLYFLGGSFGAFVASASWRAFGWTGVCVYAEVATVAAILVHSSFAKSA